MPRLNGLTIVSLLRAIFVPKDADLKVSFPVDGPATAQILPASVILSKAKIYGIQRVVKYKGPSEARRDSVSAF